MKVKLFFFTISAIGVLLVAGGNGFPSVESGDNPMEQREEKLKAF